MHDDECVRKPSGIMRPISWLHVSDIHLQAGREWSQNVVLDAMCRNVIEQREAGESIDFILVTGDIAYSGNTQDYALASRFFDTIQSATGVPRDLIFCVPGNHDIDRARQRMCFRGSRMSLTDPGQVDLFLEGGEDLRTLLLREESYRQFQENYFSDQNRVSTADGLGYVALIEIDGISVAIVGLDSAWLSNGGGQDIGELIIGERQTMNAAEVIRSTDPPPNVVIGMVHHPLHFLKDFDRLAVQNRIEERCHFLHCGHLHESEARATGTESSGCLTLTSGALFEGRTSPNEYCRIELDLLHAKRTVNSFRYDSQRDRFSEAAKDEYDFDVSLLDAGHIGELAAAIRSHSSSDMRWPHYLAGLLLKQKAELAIPTGNGHTFGTIDVLRSTGDSDLKRTSENFLSFRNALGVLFGRVPMDEIFEQYANGVVQYGDVLAALSKADPDFLTRLDQFEEDARQLSPSPTDEYQSYTHGRLADIAEQEDWAQLRQEAERHVQSGRADIASASMRMLALALANLGGATDKAQAIDYYRQLADQDMPQATDFGNLAILLVDCGLIEEGVTAAVRGIQSFRSKSGYFREICVRIVVATGDRELRRRFDLLLRN